MPITSKVGQALGLNGARKLPTFLLAFYFLMVTLSAGNYTFYVRFQEDVFGTTMVNVYLAFTVLGAIAYFFVAGVAWLWAAKYTWEHEDRVLKVGVGAFAMAICHDVPLFTIEWVLVQCCGFERNTYFGFVFVCQCVAFACSFIACWLLYIYVAAERIQAMYNWPVEDQAATTAAKKRAMAEASAIKTHFTMDWHEPGTEVLGPDERDAPAIMQAAQAADYATPPRKPFAVRSSTVMRTRIDIDGGISQCRD
jgi:hypothetical protein